MDNLKYVERFPFPDTYAFLKENGLGEEGEAIKISSDKFGRYCATLKRAKIIALLRDKNLLDSFCDKVWPSGLTEKGESQIKKLKNLFIDFNNEQEGITSEDEEENEFEDKFAYEKDLQRYLVKNLSVIEKGLKLYQAEGVDGEEFNIAETSRRIDILAVDKDNNFVVIELKVSRGYEKVVGQALFYQSSIKTIFKQNKVRAIIIAREITPELKTATQFLPDFKLFEYQLSFTLNEIK